MPHQRTNWAWAQTPARPVPRARRVVPCCQWRPPGGPFLHMVHPTFGRVGLTLLFAGKRNTREAESGHLGADGPNRDPLQQGLSREGRGVPRKRHRCAGHIVTEAEWRAHLHLSGSRGSQKDVPFLWSSGGARVLGTRGAERALRPYYTRYSLIASEF